MTAPKSVGNVVDPHDMLDVFDLESFRWNLCREAPYGGELSFSEKSLRDMRNAYLMKALENLVQRVAKLCKKYYGGTVPNVPHPEPSVLNNDKARKAYAKEIKVYTLEGPHEGDGGAHAGGRGQRGDTGLLRRERLPDQGGAVDKGG